MVYICSTSLAKIQTWDPDHDLAKTDALDCLAMIPPMFLKSLAVTRINVKQRYGRVLDWLNLSCTQLIWSYVQIMTRSTSKLVPIICFVLCISISVQLSIRCSLKFNKLNEFYWNFIKKGEKRASLLLLIQHDWGDQSRFRTSTYMSRHRFTYLVPVLVQVSLDPGLT